MKTGFNFCDFIKTAEYWSDLSLCRFASSPSSEPARHLSSAHAHRSPFHTSQHARGHAAIFPGTIWPHPARLFSCQANSSAHTGCHAHPCGQRHAFREACCDGDDSCAGGPRVLVTDGVTPYVSVVFIQYKKIPVCEHTEINTVLLRDASVWE